MDKKSKISALNGRHRAAGFGSEKEFSEAYKFFREFAYYGKGKNELYEQIKKEGFAYLDYKDCCLVDFIQEIPLVGMRKVTKNPHEWKFAEPFLLAGERRSMKRLKKDEAQTKLYVSSFMGIAGLIYSDTHSEMNEYDEWENLLLNMTSSLVGTKKENLPRYFYLSKKEAFSNLKGIDFKRNAYEERWKERYQDNLNPTRGFIYNIALLKD